MSTPPRCPHCHQPLSEVREGVRMPTLKARIFDLIHAAGDIGISTADLLEQVYGNQRYRETVRSHIHQINDLLAATDYSIKSIDRRAWVLTRKRVRRVA